MADACFLNQEESLLVCHDLNDFKSYEDQLYEIFMDIYEAGTIMYNGTPVKMKHFPPDYGERSGFYHLTCENYEHTGREEDRSPDLRRCERLKWPQEVIENCAVNCSDLLVWENSRYGKQNILLFCPQLDYLVVLGKRNGYLLLTTAYPVRYRNRRENLLCEYERYKQTTHPV